MVNYILGDHKKEDPDLRIGEIILTFINPSTKETFYKVIAFNDSRISWGFDDDMKRFKNFPVISGYKTKEPQIFSNDAKDIWHIRVLDMQESFRLEEKQLPEVEEPPKPEPEPIPKTNSDKRLTHFTRRIFKRKIERRK